MLILLESAVRDMLLSSDKIKSSGYSSHHGDRGWIVAGADTGSKVRDWYLGRLKEFLVSYRERFEE